MAKRVGQVVVVVAMSQVPVVLEQREKATQAGWDSLLGSLSMSRLALVAARAVLAVLAPVLKAVMVAATGQTFTPTAPPAVRVLERGLVVALARQ